LQQFGYFSSISPGVLGAVGVGFTKFPEFYGKLSKYNKNKRLLKEIREK
jgi:hypothetical protein